MGHYASDCTNKKVMIILDSGEVISEEEKADVSDEEAIDYPVRGELPVTRRSLKVQSKPDEDDQRENIFHTRCVVYDKVCSLIIDGGRCTNVASESLVEKLGLKTRKHPKPYLVQWLNKEVELKVTNQVMVPITIGRYQDEIVCDVLPMDSSISCWEDLGSMIKESYMMGSQTVIPSPTGTRRLCWLPCLHKRYMKISFNSNSGDRNPKRNQLISKRRRLIS